MGQYRKGSYVNAASPLAQTITLGFVPDHFIVYSRAPSVNTAIARAEWFSGMASPSGTVWTTNGSGIPVISSVTTNGFTTFSTGASYTATAKTITGATKANPCVITCTSHGFATGDIITISSVVGMVQLNTNRYKVVVVNSNSFSLQDLFGNAVDSTAYGTYVSGGQANLISSSATTPLGLQYDTGSAGIIIGTSVVGIASDTMDYEAFLSTPTGW